MKSRICQFKRTDASMDKNKPRETAGDLCRPHLWLLTRMQHHAVPDVLLELGWLLFKAFLLGALLDGVKHDILVHKCMMFPSIH